LPDKCSAVTLAEASSCKGKTRNFAAVRWFLHAKYPVCHENNIKVQKEQEALLSPSDRAMRLVSSNLASCHATVQKLLIRQVLTKLIA